MDYDRTVYTVTVVVTNNNGKLDHEITIDKGGKLAFCNVYNPDPILVTLKGEKNLVGKELKKGMFSFQLMDAAGRVLETVRNKADGSFAFSAIKYTEEGTYTYTVSEVSGDDDNMDYDQTVYTVTVVVTDNNGELEHEITIDKGGKLAFCNVYNPDPILVTLKGVKSLVGKELEKDMFSFQLMDAEGKVLETVRNKADGSFAFSAIEYAEEGTYTYTDREVKGTDQNVTYDPTVYTVTVVVTNNNGKLEQEITIDNGGELAFANTYTMATPKDICVPIVVRKLLVNKSNACITSAGFRFEMTGDTDTKHAVSNLFGFTGYVLKFSAEDVGKTFTYTIKEVDTGIEGMKYSDTVYTVRITIAQNDETGKLVARITIDGIPMYLAVVTFVNIYEPEIPEVPTEPSEPTEPTEPTEPSEPTEPTEPTEPIGPDTPDTGDDSDIVLWSMMAGLSATAIIMPLVFKRKIVV